MSLRWTDEQLEAHRRRLDGAKGSEVHVGHSPKVTFIRNEKTPAPKSKYGNVAVGKHASKKESRRAQELHLMVAAGTITHLREQVRFELIPAQYVDGKCVERAIVYICDFSYISDGVLVTEDVKGYRTPIYRLKRKLMLWIHKIRITEV